jgi:hypothetical protein
MLERYYECNNIDQVILINNNREKTPTFPKSKKLLYVEPHENIYVNPAWNLGVRAASNDNIIISNDDLMYDVNVYTNVLNAIIEKFQGLQNLGIIGMHEQNYSIEQTSNTIELKAHMGKPAWACLLTTHRSVWPIIPEQLKIYYGDDFLKKKLSNKIFDLVGLKVQTIMSSSADTKVDWVKRITEKDAEEWSKILING